MSVPVVFIPSSLTVPSQAPLDAKAIAINEAALKDLGEQDNLAYRYYKGLVVYCAEEGTRWEWKPTTLAGTATGLLVTPFTYPPGLIVNGIDYSNLTYDFYPVVEAVSKVSQLQNDSGFITTEELAGISSDKNYVYEQNLPSAIWEITHNLNKYPSVTIIDSAGTVVEGQIDHTSPNTITLTFNGAFSGKATLN